MSDQIKAACPTCQRPLTRIRYGAALMNNATIDGSDVVCGVCGSRVPIPRPDFTAYMYGGEPTETGLWCSRCNLPSGIAFPVMMMTLTGVSQIASMTICNECECPV